MTRQTMEGYIGWEPEGENGFGYDPIFYLDEYGCSSAAISPEQKNAISHRGKALRAMKELLKKPSFWGLLMKLKKIFEKFKKVVDFIARLYYNLSCVTDETQTTRTQQHSLRGVAQLG